MVSISESNKIFIYKLTTDNGGAPCVYNRVLSLAICKPKIRSVANENDWIVGFGAKSTIGERLIYICQVTNKLDSGKYYRLKEYFNRPDCIYRWDESKKKFYWESGKSYHPRGLWLEHDLGSISSSYNKANTLMSDHFKYFGKNGNDLFQQKYKQVAKLVKELKRNHRVNYSSSLRKELIELIKEYMRYKNSNIPSEDDLSKICNNDSDSYYSC